MFGRVEDYPRDLAEFERRFATEEACRASLPRAIAVFFLWLYPPDGGTSWTSPSGRERARRRPLTISCPRSFLFEPMKRSGFRLVESMTDYKHQCYASSAGRLRTGGRSSSQHGLEPLGMTGTLTGVGGLDRARERCGASRGPGRRRATGGISRHRRHRPVAENLEWFTNLGGQIDRSKIPSTKPPVIGFFHDDERNIWVDRVRFRSRVTFVEQPSSPLSGRGGDEP